MLKISSLISQFRESFHFKGKSTFWFGGIIALVSKQIANNDLEIVKDLDSSLYSEFLQILNHAVTSAMAFYPQIEPDNFFKFIAFCHEVLPQSQPWSSLSDFNLVLSRLTLKNNLIIHSFTIKQYAYVFRTCEQVLNELKQSRIDSFNEVYLAFFSNFLLLLNKVQPIKRNHPYWAKIKQSIEQNLIATFYKIVQKFARIFLGQGSIDLTEFQLLAAIFIKNKKLLEKVSIKFYQLIELILSQTKHKRLQGSVYISKIFKQRVQKQVIFYFQVPYFEYNYFYQTLSLQNSRKQLKRYSTKDETQKQEQDKNQLLQKIIKSNVIVTDQVLHSQLQNSNSINNRFRRLYLLTQNPKKPLTRTIPLHKFTDTISSTIDQNVSFVSERKTTNFSIRNQVTSQMIPPTKIMKQQKQKFPRMQTRRLGINQSPAVRMINSMHQVLHFKMGSIFIQVNDDGILLSDYTKQNKRYIEWNTLSAILPQFQFRFVYSEYLKYPVFNYYDLIRMIKLYVSKNQNGTICVNQHPNTVLQLNEFVKFYPQDGKYTKLAHMHVYDNQKLQGALDCYFQQFDHFFKVVSTNGYLNYLSSKIFADIQPETNKNEIFYLEVIRKQQQSTKAQLENQLKVDIIQNVTGDKNYAHEAIFILKNNTKIYAKINLIEENHQRQYFEIQVKRLNKPAADHLQVLLLVNTARSFELPYYKILQYIPLYDMNINTYAQQFGRMIFQFFNNFEDLCYDLNMSTLHFEIVCHFYLTQMIEIGKYFTVVSAEFIGTKTQIFGLVIRYNFLPGNRQVITFLINPYYGFLANFISLPQDQKVKSFKKLLVNQNVKDTYLYLEKAKKINRIISLIEYLSEGIGLF